MIWYPPLTTYSVPGYWGGKVHPGSFGARRRHDIHCGVDLYTYDGAEVFAVETGKVEHVAVFTGPELGTSWWLHTEAVLVRGESGYITYGEIVPVVAQGDTVSPGQLIGHVTPVLPPYKLRNDIPGHSCSMLHFELASHWSGDWPCWDLGQPRPRGLLDPSNRLHEALWASVRQGSELGDMPF